MTVALANRACNLSLVFGADFLFRRALCGHTFRGMTANSSSFKKLKVSALLK